MHVVESERIKKRINARLWDFRSHVKVLIKASDSSLHPFDSRGRILRFWYEIHTNKRRQTNKNLRVFGRTIVCCKRKELIFVTKKLIDRID